MKIIKSKQMKTTKITFNVSQITQYGNDGGKMVTLIEKRPPLILFTDKKFVATINSIPEPATITITGKEAEAFEFGLYEVTFTKTE